MQNSKTPPQTPQPWYKKNLFIFLVAFIIFLIVIKFLDAGSSQKGISYTEFKDLMNSNPPTVQKLVLQRNPEGYQVSVHLPNIQKDNSLFNSKQNVLKLQVPASNEFNNLIEQWSKNIEVQFKRKSEWQGWLSSLLPFIIIFAVFWFIYTRQSQGSNGKGIFSFGKIKISQSTSSDVTFNQVAGCEEAKQDLQEIIEFLKAPSKFVSLGAKIPKGALLLGSPGTGKTLLAKAASGEAKVPFFSISGSDFVEMFVGVGASRVRNLFEEAKKSSPCIIFIDEIDAVGRHRGSGVGGGHDEREQTLNQLLVEMDGFSSNLGIIILAATNRPDVLDPALLRPGRFDRQIIVDPPDSKGREAILNIHLALRQTPLDSNVDLTKIAKGTPGLVGADLENLINEAALLAARFNKKEVSMVDFEEAKDKIMIGTERLSRILTDEERKVIAYHEAGHALITELVKYKDPLHKVTIIPRGQALGITFSLPEKDQYMISADYILDRIAITMGGRESEHLFFKHRTTGASNDIQVATDLARRFVCEYGMSEKIGPLNYNTKQENIFLGKGLGQSQTFSDKMNETIDLEIKKIVTTQMERVKELIAKHKKKLINLAEALLEHETLEGEEIQLAFKGKKISSAKKSRTALKVQKTLTPKKIKRKITQTA